MSVRQPIHASLLCVLGACEAGTHPSDGMTKTPSSHHRRSGTASTSVASARALPAPATAPPGDVERALRTRWKTITKESRWRSPTVVERDGFRDAMRALFAAAEDCTSEALTTAREQLLPLGFEVRSLDAPDLWLIEERESAWRGGGLYALRCGPAKPWVLQAPHSFFDIGTGAVVRKLFSEHPVRAAFWNTVHRYQGAGEGKDAEVHPADVAHEFGSLFHAATVAAAMGDASLQFIQLHGMESRSRDVEAVLSTGLRDLQPGVLASALRPVVGRVALFGRDTRDLGATTNVQQQALNRNKPGRFLHVELSKAQRDRLRRSKKKRAALVEALARPWW